METIKIMCPVQGGVITQGYGNNRIYEKLPFHAGIDIGVNNNPTDIPVYCCKSGKIIYINRVEAQGGGFGLVVYILLPDGYYSIYAHLQSINSELGNNTDIQVGNFIGIMGTTGNSTGIHLHYEERLHMTPGFSRQPTDIINLYQK